MKIDTTIHSSELSDIFPELFELAPWRLWNKRAQDLIVREEKNKYLTEYFDDKFPLERTLSQAMGYRRITSRYPTVNRTTDLRYYQLYSFVTTIVRMSKELSPRGQTRLRGYIRDGLNSDTGLAPVALEMAVAAHLCIGGFDIECTDLEGIARFDFLARKEGLELEVDCKTASGDVGRPIHRRRMIELFHRIQPAVDICMARRGGSALHITIPTALHGREEYMKGVAAVVQAAARENMSVETDQTAIVKIARFDVDRGPFSNARTPSRQALADFVRVQLGRPSAHAISVHRPGEAAVVITIESERPDNVAEGIYRSLKESADHQFSRTRPALLAVRLTDLTQTQLLELAAQRRHGLAAIADRLLASENRQHLYGIAFVAPSQSLTASEVPDNSSAAQFQDRGSALLFRNDKHPLVADPRLDVFQLFSSADIVG